MKIPRSLWLHGFRLLFALAVGVAPTVSLQAQTTPARVTGRVFNPATKDYVRSAQVRIEGTDRIVETESDGSFRFDNVPAGEVTLSVTYTGYTATPDRFTLAAGQTAVREILVTSTLTYSGAKAGADEPLQLQQFVVSSAREGDAKAIMDQRRNMNITTSVASDVFGDVADGNVGEFLKFLPGVDIEYQEAESRGPRLGGLDPQYTGVTIDGVNLASADAFVSYGATENGTVGGAVRSVGFESMSINSVESIEINRTLSPDMDANAAAGSINMKSKRAFDRKGRSISFTIGAAMNSDEFHFNRTYGPDDRKHYKVRPNAIFEYSDVFFNQRLGVRLNLSESNSYSEEYRLVHTYNTTPTPTDPRPMVLTGLAFKDGPKFIEKFAATLTTDYKATSRLTLSVSAIFNAYDTLFYSRSASFTAAANNTNANLGRSTVIGDLNSIQTSGAANTSKGVGLGPSNADKLTNTITVYPSFEYKLNQITVTGVAAYSKSKNDYESIERGLARAGTVNNVVADFRATRPDIQSASWTIVQTGGADWGNLANYTNPRITNEGRYALDEIYSGQADVKYTLPFRRIPSFVKVGVKAHEETRKSDDLAPYNLWNYIGPGGGTTGSWAGYQSPLTFDLGKTDALTVANMPPQVDSRRIASLFRDRPDYFVRTTSAANFYNGVIANHRDFQQLVNAGYAMGNARLTNKLQVQGGVRWESTLTKAHEFDPLSNAEVAAAGHTISAGGQPTTIEGYAYKFFTKPRVTREGEYENFFPSFSVKYNAARNLQAQFGYSHAISRAPVNDLAGVWVIDEINETITAPNPTLKPEISDNYVARVAYYFEPVGQFSVQVSQNEISDLRITSQRVAADALEFVEPEYANYDFIVTRNSAREWRFRGMEVAYSQGLSFLPGALRGTSVRVAYTRTYANERRPGLAPHKIAGNLGWSYKRVSLGVGAIWLDDTPFTSNYGFYRKHNIKFDVNGAFRFSRRLSFYFQGRNALNQSHEVYQGVGVEGEGAVLQRMGNFGAAWVFGVKGNF
jgi:iron complex outermembrane recepter protein